MTRREVRRDDDELVGMLVPAQPEHVDARQGRWVPATVFGAPLGEATDLATAERVVRERGLSSLAGRWWVRRAGATQDGWHPAWLLEVKPDRLRVRWDDPMLMQGGHGEWIRLSDIEIRLQAP